LNGRALQEWNKLAQEPTKLLLGRQLARSVARQGRVSDLAEVEFRVFSEYGDDGIIQWLVHHLDLPQKTFIEFGVEDYRESNTRFLLMNDNWSGFVMDGSGDNVSRIVQSEYYPRHDLIAIAAFVDCENIDALLQRSGFDPEVGILHIDIDGNDYWVWKRITAVTPIVVIAEYNAVFGAERAITIPYDSRFHRTQAHHSNLYFGASLRALHGLAAEKGYAFIGCNSAGNNAYFVRLDRLNDTVREIPLEKGFVGSKFRESRDADGRLSLLSGDARLETIRGLPVLNLDTGMIEPL
jgi:hypothetical protein